MDHVWLSCVFGGLPLLVWLLWWWNELWHVLRLKLRGSNNGAKLPPGHMGFPIFGEILTFLWYFKILRRPDDFINSKRHKYGDGAGLYRTYLFGSPSIIACSPMVNKYITRSDDFILQWLSGDLMGRESLVTVHGESHARLRSLVINAINRPDALRRIAATVQPRLEAALNSWLQSPRINAYKEIKKITFENIGKIFASLEPGALLDEMDKLFDGLVKGVRAHPFNIPGTAFHKALQCRRKLEAIFWREIEKKKENGEGTETDLLDGLMKMKDEDGNQLSDKEVLDNIVSLVIGGYEPSTLASMWAVYYLAKYPQALHKLREENKAICKKKKGDFLTIEDVSQLKYTNKVVEETIRLANIAQILFRFVTKEVEYKGYRIPKGWKVIVWNRYLHTNPENFEDPLCFNPDRWNNPVKPGTYHAASFVYWIQVGTN